METKHLSYFKVENFKRFDSLEVNDVGQFNLIVGDNNVGKTSLLEALLFDENPSQFLANIWFALTFKKIKVPNVAKKNYLDFYTNESNPIIYRFNYEDEILNKIQIKKKHLSSLSKEEIEGLENNYKMLHGPMQHLIEFKVNDQTHLKFISFNNETDTFSTYVPLVYFSSNFAEDILELFSKISIHSDKLDEFVNEIKHFIPNLISIEINTAIIPDTSVLAIREKNADLKPLAQYGDGAIKLFRNLLELNACEGKRLMIDEIDTGIHYRRMKEFLKQIIQSAKNKNVQLFATTHSKECLEYYTQALQELGYENEGRIIRIANTKSGIKAYTMRFEEFENALEGDNEIR